MIYKAISGVVLTSICGEYLLVAGKDARAHCPYVTQINETSAFLFKRLKRGAAMEELLAAVNDEYEVDDPISTREAVENFLAEMLKLGYIVDESVEI